jgi:hypothetical protein
MLKKVISSIAVTGLLLVGVSQSVSAASHVVTPDYISATELYSVPYQDRGQIRHGINVTKYGDANDRISAKYWIGHTLTKANRVGVTTAFDSLRMSIHGYWSPGTAYEMQDMRIQTVGDGNTKEIRAFKDITNSTFGALGFVYNIKTPLTFAKVDMASGPWHSIGGFMLGDYTPIFNMDHTKVRGFSVQPNPGFLFSGINENNAAVEDTNAFPETEWTLITIDSIKESKEHKELADNIKVELINGVDDSLIEKVSFTDYLLNQDYYEEVMEEEHVKALKVLNEIE